MRESDRSHGRLEKYIGVGRWSGKDGGTRGLFGTLVPSFFFLGAVGLRFFFVGIFFMFFLWLPPLCVLCVHLYIGEKFCLLSQLLGQTYVF